MDPDSSPPTRPSAHLRDEVRAFGLGPFRLAHDLDAIQRVRTVDAPEAVVFYGGRILEALAAAAVARLGLEAPPNPFSCLVTLEQMGLLGDVDGYVGHALRRLGNGVRHIGWRPDPDDGDVVFALAFAWITWFFVTFPLGPRLPAVVARTSDAPTGVAGRLLAWLAGLGQSLRQGGGEPPDLPDLVSPADATLGPGQVALVCVAADTCIAGRRHDQAERILRAARAQAPDDVRLLQLEALLSSRRGDVQGAIALLEPLLRSRPDDPETVGILAGALKRRAGADPASPDLARAQRLYLRGWRTSRGHNTWLGINAATTALFAGDAGRARQVAAAVRRRLEDRQAALDAVGAGGLPPPYWHAVTRAEALLLEGRKADALAAYREAFARHPVRRDDRATTMAQADAILRHTGDGLDLATLLERG